MAFEVDGAEYSSPTRKLTRFFLSSRDRWKAKYHHAKAANKLLSNQVRAVERSRERWKQQVDQQKRRLAELEAELQKNRRCHRLT